jgi:thiosulfate/3-mercaptopyruvate sulfurtransferase
MRSTLMNGGRSLWLALTFLFGFIGAAFAGEPLVDAAWVKANLSKPGVVLIDVRSASDYLRGHIPGAVNTDVDKSGWVEERAGVPHEFPEKLDKLAAYIGSIGIDNTTHVVVLSAANHYNDMYWPTRVYWTFKVLGHENVSILNGGMSEWTKNKANPLETGAAKVATAKTFTVHLNKETLATVNDIKAALEKKTVLVDSRPEDQFAGINRHPKATESGTLPGARNLPISWALENGGGVFRPKSELEKLFKVANVPTSGDQINFCNTGLYATIGWFVASELMGNKKAKMYDGSMTEWTITKAGPVEHKISLK